MTIGILGIQGGFDKHRKMIDSLGYEAKIVRTPEEIKKTNALIIPGGESTTFLNLFEKLDLRDAITEYNKTSPIMGTCAGLIVLSRFVDLLPYQPLGLIDICVDRNAYGRQKESFIKKIEINFDNSKEKFEAVFIRAPIIKDVGKKCRILAKYKNDHIMIENDSILVCTFHPELTDNPLIHKYFLTKFLK